MLLGGLCSIAVTDLRPKIIAVTWFGNGAGVRQDSESVTGRTVGVQPASRMDGSALLEGRQQGGGQDRRGCLLRIFLGVAAAVADFVGEFCNGFGDGHDLLFLRPEPPHSDGLFVYFALSHGQ